MSAQLTPGLIAAFLQKQHVSPVIQIQSVKQVNPSSPMIACKAHDGQDTCVFVITNPQNDILSGAVIRIDAGKISEKPNTAPKIVVSAYTTLAHPQQQQQQPPQQQQQRPPQQNQMNNNNQKVLAAKPRNQQQNNNNNSNNQMIHPINSLNAYNRRWTIQGRVTFKSDIKRWDNNKSSGQLFSFNLLDKQGGEIKITCFSEATDLFFDMIESGKVYTISKGQLKPAQKKFSSLKNPYEITLDQNSVVTPTEDDSIPSINFSFTEIAGIRDLSVDDTVDVIGVVFEATPLVTITTKSGKELDKRTITIGDPSMAQIEVTLWGDAASTLMLPDDQPNPIIACKSLKVSDFADRTLSTNYGASTLILNPDVSEAVKLRQWADSTDMSQLHFVSLTNKGNMTHSSTVSGTATHTFVGNLKEMVIADPTLSSKIWAATGWLTGIKHEIPEGQVKHPMFYRCCPTPECLKGVEEDSEGLFTCTKCAKTTSEHSYAYMISMAVADPTGTCWCTAFKPAAVLFNEMPAKDLENISQQDPEQFNQIIYDACYRPVELRLKAKYDTYQDKPTVKVTVDKISPISFKAGCHTLLSSIRAFTD